MNFAETRQLFSTGGVFRNEMLRFLLPLRKIKSFGLIMKTKIAIVGTGGVGGFLGGLLARRYRDDPEVTSILFRADKPSKISEAGD